MTAVTSHGYNRHVRETIDITKDIITQRCNHEHIIYNMGKKYLIRFHDVVIDNDSIFLKYTISFQTETNTCSFKPHPQSTSHRDSIRLATHSSAASHGTHQWTGPPGKVGSSACRRMVQLDSWCCFTKPPNHHITFTSPPPSSHRRFVLLLLAVVVFTMKAKLDFFPRDIFPEMKDRPDRPRPY